jgi:hypothetical protein
VDLYIHSPIRLHGVVLNWLSTRTTLPFTSQKILLLMFLMEIIVCYCANHTKHIHTPTSLNLSGDICKPVARNVFKLVVCIVTTVFKSLSRADRTMGTGQFCQTLL